MEDVWRDIYGQMASEWVISWREGWQEGWPEGWQEGWLEGWQKGQEEAVRNFLTRLLESGEFSLDEIADLAKPDIERLRRSKRE